MRQVLVVDDEPAIREVLIEFLTEHGYEARGAEDGQQAIALAESVRPAVVLCDIWMPGMSGIETLERLLQLDPAPAVIMISGHADHEVALRALDLGAYDFIQKPLDFQYLERTLLARMVTLDADGAADRSEGPAHEAAPDAGRRPR